MKFHEFETYLRSPFGLIMNEAKNGVIVANTVSNAQKFYGGDMNLFFNIPAPKELPRLPYNLCVFEFNVNNNCIGVSNSLFIIAQNIENGFIIHPFIQANHGNNRIWINLGYSLMINGTSTNRSIHLSKKTIEFLEKATTSGLNKDGILSMFCWLNGFMCLFLSVLNCVNVNVEEVVAPPKVNAKRIKKGKIPIYTYKTLVLSSRQRLAGHGGGTHDSPRVHLRRGHIKHRKTGDFWWEPCVVGDRKKGIVMKDYRADELMACH